MTDQADNGNGLDLEAGEYVLGTLSAAERTAFAERLRHDERLRQAVGAWESRLAALAFRAEPVRPSAETWESIARELGGAGRKPMPLRVIEGGNRAGRALAKDTDYRRSRDRWRLGALAACAATALLALVVVRGGFRPGENAGSFVAAVNRGGDQPALLVHVDLKSRQVVVRPVAAEVPAGRSLELWFISGRGAPRSMGLVSETVATLPMPADANPSAGQTFAVSVEPPGGSKTGNPTGPVVYSGRLIEE